MRGGLETPCAANRGRRILNPPYRETGRRTTIWLRFADAGNAMAGMLILMMAAFVAIAIIGRMALNLRDRVRALESGVRSLEQKLGAGGAVAPPQAAPIAEASQALPPSEPAHAPAAIPRPQPAAAAVPLVPAVPAPRQQSLEERFGTQWVVWVGGVAIALGGFFLVRLSIQQGWFGPAARVLLGALLALVLIALGEWNRRSERITGIGALPAAHIPSILTAAGTAVVCRCWASSASKHKPLI